MSKPKPGLGKGIVRTLVHSTSTPNTTSSLQLGPSLSTVVSNYSTNQLSIHGSAGGHHVTSGGRLDFGSIGLPGSNTSSGQGRKGKGKYTYSTLFPSSSTTTVTSTSGQGNGTYTYSYFTNGTDSSRWEGDKDVVLPFRPRYTTRRPSSPTSRACISSSSSSRRSLSTLSPASNLYAPSGSSTLFPPSNLFTSIPIPSLESIPIISAFLDKSSFWSTSSTIDSLDLIVSPPSPPPSIRTRPNEVHPALSPSPIYDSTTLSSSFAQLGVPQSPILHHPAGSSSVEDETTDSASSTPQLIFHLGASGLAKERPAYTPPKRTASPAPPPRPRSFPLPDVTPPEVSEMRSVGVGEDAYFARMDGMCIADGVGGWAKSGRGGADAGRWSRLLTHFCEVELGMWDQGLGVYADNGQGGKSVRASEEWSKKVWENAMDPKGGKDNWAKASAARLEGVGRDSNSAKLSSRAKGKRKALDPVEIMQRGFEKCLACFTNEGIHGSSTCLLACLHDSTLSIANLGDCALLLIRSNEIIFRTDEMQHAFNFPLQLGTHSRDEPMKDAKRYDVGVGKGDVVVLGSDGLMDNLFDEDILETLAQFTSPTGSSADSTTNNADDLTPFSPQKVSEALCNRAREISEQTSATTPFMVRAIEEGIDFVGGKKDGQLLTLPTRLTDVERGAGVVGSKEADEQISLLW